jgi:hypothetical protein
VDEKKEMVVVNLDVGCATTTSKCIHPLQEHSPFYRRRRIKKTLLSHYAFRLQIALAWLTGMEDTTGYKDRTKKRKKIDDSSSSTPSLKSHHVNDASLSPTNTVLRSRLDSDYHYPVPAEADRPCCSVCRWSASSRDEKVLHMQLMQCLPLHRLLQALPHNC